MLVGIENMGIDTKIIVLSKTESKILAKIGFAWRPSVLMSSFTMDLIGSHLNFRLATSHEILNTMKLEYINT